MSVEIGSIGQEPKMDIVPKGAVSIVQHTYMRFNNGNEVQRSTYTSSFRQGEDPNFEPFRRGQGERVLTEATVLHSGQFVIVKDLPASGFSRKRRDYIFINHNGKLLRYKNSDEQQGVIIKDGYVPIEAGSSFKAAIK